MYVCAYVHHQKKLSGPLELKLQMVVNHMVPKN